MAAPDAVDTDRIFLIGLSGSGKSTVALLIAEQLGWDVADTDQMIESQAGKPVSQIFAEEGEADFRLRERLALDQVSRLGNLVIATGGGAPTTAEGREAISHGFIAWLSVSPESAAARLDSNPDTEDRPLLQGDTLGRLRSLLDARQAIYEQADVVIEVDDLTPREVADAVVQAWRDTRETGSMPRPSPEPLPPIAGPSTLDPSAVAATVTTRSSGVTYPVIVRTGALTSLGAICREAGLRGRAFIVTDEQVGPRYAPAAEAALRAEGYEPHTITIPGGEEHKTLATLELVYDHMLAARIERTDFAVCLGGGVITDLGGFAAATILRGIDFVHVPTSLLGMVDASVGGKLGVDHPRGKNMVGVFAQPRAVVIDPAVLATLPARHRVNGFAELLKHGLILDGDLVTALEAGAGDPAAMVSDDLIGRSVAIKAVIVSEDERESGRRTLLNYGHTLGHAIEAVTGYSDWLHGEAVAIGMRAAGLMSVDLGLLSPAAFQRQQALLRAYGLPESAPGLPVDAVIEATRGDKKVRGGAVRWVLLEEIGRGTVRGDVPDDVVRRAAIAVLS